MCRLFIFDNQDFDNLQLYDSEGDLVDVSSMLTKQTEALQQIEQVDEDNTVNPFDQADTFQAEGTSLLDFTEENPFGEF